MRNAAILVGKFLQIILIGACVSSCSSCKDESPTNAEGAILNPPTVFIPAGILRSPAGIAVDGENNIWIADRNNDRLRKFTATGVQIDSIILTRPSAVALDKSTRTHLVVVENGTTLSRFSLPGKTLTGSYPLIPFTGNSSSVLDVNIGAIVTVSMDVRGLGDIDTSPTGDIYVSAYGTPANSVIRIALSGNFVLAVSPADSANAVARFLAVDGFGTVFTSFSVFRGPAVVPFVYALTPGNILQSRPTGIAGISRRASGAVIDPAGRLYVANPETQEVIIASTSSEVIIARHLIPDTDGYSMLPRDIALAADGTMFVVVNDRLGSETGAVLKYTRASQ